MKSVRILAFAVACCVGLSSPDADTEHGHNAAPRGGLLLDKTEPHAELVVGKDRTVTIHFYDEAMKPVAPTTQTVTVLAEKTKLDFEKEGASLVSTTKLPDGEGYNVVVQFRETPDATPVNFRFKLLLDTCAGCQLAEYACTCDH